MKAAKRIAKDGDYAIILAATPGAPPFAMQLYRNRTRLTSTESLPEITWRGKLYDGDLIEADGDFDVVLTISPTEGTDDQAEDRNHPRDDEALRGGSSQPAAAS